jgi:hypothetical protein
MDVFKELADINPEQDVRPLIKDYIEIKDKENGTDVLSAIQFPTDLDAETPEVPAAEPSAELPAAEPAPEELPMPAPVAEEKEDPPFDGPYKKSGDNKDRYGNTIKHPAKHAAKKGMAAAIAKAKKAGATAETVIRIAGQEMTLGEAITKAGMKVEDIFGNKKEAAANELIEFVKSMFNKEEGTFPKGETGVLIACEKKFGEGAVPVAQQVIEKLQHAVESRRLRELAGLTQQR